MFSDSLHRRGRFRMSETCTRPRSSRIALVEPSKGDAQWFREMLAEAGLDAMVTRYETGVAAVDEWCADGFCAFDVVVTADVLPMLDVRTVVDTAQTLNPDVNV